MPLQRILVSAYEYHPKGVSEAWTASQLVAALRRRGHRVVVTTRATRNKPRWYGVARLPCVIPKWPQLWAPNYLEYLFRSTRVAARLQRKISLVQHISPITLRAPNLLGLLKVPFIWGPVGGCIPFPPGFERYGRESGLLNHLRQMDSFRLNHDPSLLFTMRSAARIIVTSSMAGAMLPENYRSKAVVIPEGLAAGSVLPGPAGEEPYIFSSGRLLSYKGLDLLIRAFAQLQAADAVKLVIHGEGPMRSRLQHLIDTLGLGARVTLGGWVEKQESLRCMSRSLFCVFPSLKEAFGHVNLEAMAAWKPVVVTDWAGPRDLVENGVTGIKVLGKNPDEHVAMLAGAMQRLVDDPALRKSMGAAGAARVASEYQWDVLASRYETVYAGLG